MTLGVEVNVRALPPIRSTSTRTGRWMVLSTTAVGPLMTPTLLRSPAHLAEAFGPRDGANRIAYDSAELFFRSGGAELVLVRLGSSAVVKDRALYDDALDALDASWGPGQVSIPGEVGDAHAALLAHAAATGRIAILDEEVDTFAAERLIRQGDLAAVAGAHLGQVFGPWVAMTGPTGETVNTPASAQVAARINAMDVTAGHAGRAPIADQGLVPPAGASVFGLGLAQRLTSDEQEQAFTAGFGLLTTPAETGLPTVQSFRSLATTDLAYGQLTVGRMAQDLRVRFDAVAGRFRGRGLTRDVLREFGGALKAECLRLTAPDGPVFDTGDPLRPPYTVDVGPAVNTDLSIASGIGRAAVGVRLAPYLDLVVIDVAARIAGS